MDIIGVWSYYIITLSLCHHSTLLSCMLGLEHSGVHRCLWEMFSVCKTNLTVVVDTNCMYKYVSYTNLLVPMSMCCVHVCCVRAELMCRVRVKIIGGAHQH